MNSPSPTIVVDAAVLVAAARGRSSGAVLRAARERILVTTDRAVREACRRVELGMKRRDLVPVVEALASEMNVIPVASLAPMAAAAEACLRDAVAGGNGSNKDAHVLALAWAAESDIWSTDRDFAGTGIASWSTPNLMRGLIELPA